MGRMGEGRTEDSDRAGFKRRFTVPEAARALGISPEAVRTRLSRGTLEGVRTGLFFASGQLYIQVVEANISGVLLVNECRLNSLQVRCVLNGYRHFHNIARLILWYRFVHAHLPNILRHQGLCTSS
jgi:hypothetical protein